MNCVRGKIRHESRPEALTDGARSAASVDSREIVSMPVVDRKLSPQRIELGRPRYRSPGRPKSQT